MPQHLLELLDLSFRWVHVIAGIMWIGNSLLFNWLDRNLRPSTRGAPEVYGDIWLLPSGAFYFVEKTSLSGQPMPRPLPPGWRSRCDAATAVGGWPSSRRTS